MANRNWLKGAAVVLIAVLALAACSGKGGGGGGKANPATDFKYDLNEAGDGIIIFGYIGDKGGKVVIPAKIEGYPVVQIGEKTGPDGVSTSTDLKDLGFYEYSQATLENLMKRDPNHKSVAWGNRNRTARITSVVIPDTVTYIGNSTFCGLEGLKTITLPKSLKVIGNNAFAASGLTSIVIPEGVTQIGVLNGEVFSNCKNLSSVTLPESLEELSGSTFSYCNELTTVKLPSHTIKYLWWNDPMFYKQSDEEIVRRFRTDRMGNVVIIIDPKMNGSFKGCPKLSLAARKAIQDSGYTGDF